jgi:carbonic anhydrase
VRIAADALERVGGTEIASGSNFRERLLGVAVYLNAAITAYDVQRELLTPPASGTRVVYGVFDLVAQRVRARPGQDAPIFAEVPAGPGDFTELAAQLAKSYLGK